MGRILEYVLLLSNLSLVLGASQYLRTSHQPGNYERGNEENFTHSVKQHFPREKNDFFGKGLPLGPQGRRRSLPYKQMLSTVGLHAYAIDDRKRNSSDQNFRFSDPTKRNTFPPFSQGLYPRRNPKIFSQYFPSQKLSRLNNHSKTNNSLEYRNGADGFSRRYAPTRNARYHHSPKVCDPCNSVPWIPLLKVPDSYRQQRTHITELHPTPHQNFNFDYHAYPSDTHNVLLPPVPLPPPIYDGTISSSFGLPVGNIPTSHGLLAPISHLATDAHTINTVDYSNSFNYYSPHGLLENNNFPELSPVPVVPIHDSGQFFQFDSSIPDLVPPPSKPIDVSNVVLTISENQNLVPPNHKNSPPDLASQSSAVDFHAAKEKNRGNDFGRLEIVKSVPLAEFTSQNHQQQLPLYPPLQSDFSEGTTSKTEFISSDHLSPPSQIQNVTYSKTGDAKEEASAPKPLTSPSLSWLFSDHTSPPAESKTTSSVSSFAADVHEIASVVNNELRPVSPHPILVTTPSVGASKGKKIQIIIPYTTKGKSEHDNNALESVQREVFQPPTGKSTIGNSLRDLATSARPPATLQSVQKEPKSEKYLSEMHHIIASNIRELLREEIEKSQKDQNYPLQNNIDNWTALEYSNHKTVGTKAPKEIIAQALAVTSIPGTSISHLLLPSKKIPNEYFVTTPLPVYDEPNAAAYKMENSTVNSRPFTAKPYATTNVYKTLHEVTSHHNHEKNYTQVDRGRANTWTRLTENLLLPEPKTRTKTVEHTTPSSWTGSFYSSSLGSEKVHIVTPIPQRNHTTTPLRRTTRHAWTTDNPGKSTRRPLFPSRLNSTRLEKVSNLTSESSRKLNGDPTTVRPANSSASQTETTTTAVEDTTVAVVTERRDVLQLSINDIIPFRNKELPWESKHESSQAGVRIGRQRKSLIKQANLQRSKAAVGSS